MHRRSALNQNTGAGVWGLGKLRGLQHMRHATSIRQSYEGDRCGCNKNCRPSGEECHIQITDAVAHNVTNIVASCFGALEL